ncbi:MFS transporter [Weizmannia sp. CD-2023]|jgi:MFS family permease|uniref:MFS transporter n=1 Tax=Heyndrickxia TaxID=2837504 RepID=UPI00145993BD|nr:MULTISPECIES: MFS transporter [Heyndrickxia]MED4839957.1 MFS transporter [Weizmannia sp. CD-2023]MED4902477.1 MFS transporter [Weizmannia sp. CD-2023]NMH83159.1 MFS transporter [Heyndrickxia coagulans]
MLKNLIINRDFGLLWTSTAINSIGNQMSIIAFPLVGIYLYGTNAMETSIISALTFLPNLLFGSHAGVYTDLHNKKRILVVSNLANFFVLFLLFLFTVTHTLPLFVFYGGIFLSSSLGIFNGFAFFSAIPFIVDRKNLQEANYRLEITNGTIQTVGPSLGGTIIQLLTVPFAMLVDAFSFLAAGIIQLFLPNQLQAEKQEKKQTKYWGQIKESYLFVVRHEILSPIALSYFFVVLSIGLFQSLQVYYLSRVMHLNASLIGIVLSIGNIGFLIGSILSKYLSKKIGSGKSVILSLFLYSLGFFLYFIASPSSLYFIILGQMIISFAPPIYNVNVLTMRQKLVGKEMLARAAAIWRVLGKGMVPVGALIGGFISTIFQTRTAILVAVVIGLIGLIPVIMSKKLRDYRDSVD